MGEGRTEDAQWLGVGDVARIAGVHRNTVHNWIKSGRLEAHKVIENDREMYRINAASLEDVRPGAVGRNLGAQRPTEARELAEVLGQRLQEIVQSHAQEMGALREELGRERQRREELQERLREYEEAAENAAEGAGGEEPEEERTEPQRLPQRAWWRRLLGR